MGGHFRRHAAEPAGATAQPQDASQPWHLGFLRDVDSEVRSDAHEGAARLVGGELDLRSSPGGGTSVTLRVPG